MTASALTHIPEHIRRLFPRDREIILAGVSGGADSIALLHLLAEHLPRAKERLYVVHVNHNLRIREANLDEEHTQAHCTHLGLLCLVYQRPVADMARRAKLSLEEAGRLARHESFLDAALTFKAGAVVLAHHLDDQAETLLLNLIRGAGSQGLAGLRESRPFPHRMAPPGLRLVRPLLGVPKQELEHYLASRGLAWRQDQTNHDEAFTRNRIRQSLLPQLEREFTPQIKTLLARSAEALSRDDAYLAEETRRRWRQVVVEKTTGRLALSCRRLFKLHPSLIWRLLGFAWDSLAIPQKTSAHLDHLQALASGTAADFSLPGSWSARRVKDQLIFSSGPEHAAGRDYTLILDQPLCTNPAVPYGVQLEVCPKSKHFRPFLPRVSDQIVLDAERAGNRLVLRNARPGDFIRPLGMHGKRKELRKIFSEMKLSAREKPVWPVLAVGREILWVYRGPVSEAVKTTPETRKLLKIKIFKLP